MRVTTAFNRVLGLRQASVVSVEFTGAGLVLGVRRRKRLHQCPCGAWLRARYDTSRRRWRHLDFGACRVWLEADIARVDCPRCGQIRTEQVPWARLNSRHSKDFEDVVGWLAQQMNKTAVSKFMRCSWAAVDAIVGRVVAEHIDDARLDELYWIGVDEISYRRGHKYLTLVVNHDNGDVVFAVDGRTKDSFEQFFKALGPERKQQVEAVSMDMSGVYRPVTEEQAPNARIAFDPFHVIQYANKALDSVFGANRDPLPVAVDRQGRPNRRIWRHTRTALRTGGDKLDRPRLALIHALYYTHHDVWLAWTLKEDLRDFYAVVEPDKARRYLTRWIKKATTSGLVPMINLAKMVSNHFEGIVTAVELGLSNARLEGTNAKVRLIQRRGYGHHSPDSLIAMIYLCLGGITIQLPTPT